MHSQYNHFNEDARQAFRWRRRALHEIHRAIGRAGRRPHVSIHAVPTWPERITWYECPKCGRAAGLNGETPPRCPLCGVPAMARTWTQPTREAPTPPPARWTEVAVTNPWKPLPDGEYRIMRKDRTSPASRSAGTGGSR